MTPRHTLVALTAAALLTGGCLLKDVTQTWYIAGDGTVTWVVIEKDVRSDAKALVDRQSEELGYYQAVVREDHPAARGLRALGVAHLRTRILRSELPYTVVTEGRFTGLDAIGQRLIAMTGLAGTSVLVRDGTSWEWTFTARDPHAADANVDVDDDVASLMNDLDKLEAVLQSGRFESAQGFTISSDGRKATFDEDQLKDVDEDSVVVLKLRWNTGPR